MPGAQAEIVVGQNQQCLGRYLLVEDGEYLIGRDADCSIPLEDPQVSLKHARLILQQRALQIEDLGSISGTFVDDNRIEQPVILQPSQKVKLGTTILEVHRPAEDEATLRPADSPASVTAIPSSVFGSPSGAVSSMAERLRGLTPRNYQIHG